MRTKTLLLTAALAAAGVASSMAQVYSINTVGYVNVVIKGAPAFTLLANPLDDGTNTADSILGTLPNKSTLQVWGGAGFSGSTKGAAGWSPNFPLPVGTGFFVKTAGATTTNTFVGTVIPNSGSSHTSSVPSTLTLVGTTLPVSGNLNDVGPGTLNLIATLPNKSTIQTWDNSGAGVFVGRTKGAAGFSPNDAYSVGQGFFLQGASPTNWVQSLP